MNNPSKRRKEKMELTFQFECEVGGGLTHYIMADDSPF